MTDTQKRLIDTATNALEFHTRLATETEADVSRRYKTKDFHFTPAQREAFVTALMESDAQMLKLKNLAKAWIKEKGTMDAPISSGGG